MANIRVYNPHAGRVSNFLAVVRGGITVKPHVQAFADALEDALGYKLDIGTYVGHSPPEGPTQAIDVFNTVSSAGYTQQDRIVAFAKANQARYGVRYVIRRHQIWNIERDDEGFREQGVTGNATTDHLDHTHLTFYASVAVVVTPPSPPITGEIATMQVRYIWGPDALNQTDWVFDAPGQIHATGMTAQVLKACDLNKIPELGRVDDQTHSWFGSVASNWR